MITNFYTYPNQNFTCSRCKEQLFDQTLYSTSLELEKVPYHSAYCWDCVAILKLPVSKSLKCYYCSAINDERYASTTLKPWKLPSDSKTNWACSWCWNKWLSNLFGSWGQAHQKNNMPTPKKKTTAKKNTSKKLSLVPTLTKSTKRPARSPKPKSSPTGYYNCLMNYAQAGFYDPQEGKKQKIHACCKKCKQLAPTLNNQRDKELVKLITSYKQVGDSLAKLLQPIK